MALMPQIVAPRPPASLCVRRPPEKYGATAEPVDVAGTTSQRAVRAVLAGNFPGSPIELTFGFTLEDDLIVRLEIG